MNETIINNFNSVVKPKDTVYMLGDICFLPRKKLMEVLHRFNGKKHLIYGNHDKALRQELKSMEEQGKKLPFESVQDYKEISVEGQKIVLMHYALRTWNGQHRGAWQLYGHSHNNLPELPTLLSMDVGVDAHDYRPISFEQIKTHMENKINNAKKNNLKLTEDHHE
jgi:calcineurin-like phosphoesterase family protein